ERHFGHEVRRSRDEPVGRARWGGVCVASFALFRSSGWRGRRFGLATCQCGGRDTRAAAGFGPHLERVPGHPNTTQPHVIIEEAHGGWRSKAGSPKMCLLSRGGRVISRETLVPVPHVPPNPQWTLLPALVRP